MIIFLLLTLIDLHTLFVFLTRNLLPLEYSFLGGSLSILKGLIFFLPTKDLFSFLDIIVGIIVLLSLIINIHIIISIIIVLYLIYKIIGALASF